MARPLWKGHISFGLVNIPVSLYSGEQRTDLSFNLLDSRNKARVRYERVNEVTGEEVPWDRIIKAYEYEDGNYVILKDEDFERVAVEATQTVEIEDFVAQKSVDYVYFDKPYYLVPDKKGEKGYVLLREALRRTERIGIAKVVIRQRQHLAAVIPVKDALVLNILRFHQEVRDTEDFKLPGKSAGEYHVQEKELKLAEQLIESMVVKWQPERYEDEYRGALLEWIRQKAESDGEISPPEPTEEKKPAGEIIDIMGLLQRSVRGRQEETPAKRSRPATRAKAKPNTKAKAKPRPRKSAKAAPAGRKKASGER